MNTPDPNAWDDPAWDDLFRQRLENYEAEPAPDALNHILTTVNGPSAAPRSGGQGWLLVAVGLLLLSGVGWLITEIRTTTSQASVGKVAPLAQKPANVAEQAAPVYAGAAKPVAAPADVSVPQKQVFAGTESDKLAKTTPEADVVLPGSVPAVSGNRVEKQKTISLPSTAEPFTGRGLVRSASRPRKTRTPTLNSPLPPVVSSATQAVLVVKLTVKETSVQPVLEAGYANVASKLAVPLSLLTIQPMRLRSMGVNWPELNPIPASAEAVAVQPSRSRPGFYGSLMPLFTYRQINPVLNDEQYVRNVQTGKTLSANRAGWQLQLGMEWPLTRQLSLRTGLTYGVMQQALMYNLAATTPDSVHIEVVDAQTIRVTPVRAEQNVSDVIRYQYAGLNANVVWHLTEGRGWRPYVMAGASVGGYVAPNWRASGFLQASAGIERPMTANTWLRVEPTVQYGWSPVSDSRNLFTIRPYTYGLTVGLGFR